MIVIVDYGMGNLGSIQNMLKHIGVKSTISFRKEDIERTKKVILPGVGAFDNGMRNIEKLGILPLLNRKALVEKIPVLGVCLGMQLLTKKSEEGSLPGFGWINGETVRFKFDHTKRFLKIPHIGWNTIKIKKKSKLLKGLDSESRFYFVHSYHLKCFDPGDILSSTNYSYDFTSILERENIMGVQFHPEKSHKYGMKLLKNFSEL